MPIQAILFFVALLGCYGVLSRFRRKELSPGALALWLVLWAGVGVVALVPNSTARVAQLLGVGRGADVAVYLALVILFFLIFRCMVALEKMRREITVLVRALSLRDKDSSSKP